MVNAKDLRIGNWLNTNHGSLDESPFYEQVTGESIVILESVPYAAKPIPLTPELLEKCGFAESRGWLKKSVHKELDYRLGMLATIDGIDCYLIQHGSAGIMPPCKHLHQLQNLIFALTGTELEVNL